MRSAYIPQDTDDEHEDKEDYDEHTDYEDEPAEEPSAIASQEPHHNPQSIPDIPK